MSEAKDLECEEVGPVECCECNQCGFMYAICHYENDKPCPVCELEQSQADLRAATEALCWTRGKMKISVCENDELQAIIKGSIKSTAKWSKLKQTIANLRAYRQRARKAYRDLQRAYETNLRRRDWLVGENNLLRRELREADKDRARLAKMVIEDRKNEDQATEPE